MKQTEQYRLTAQQAAGFAFSAAEGRLYAAVVQRRDDRLERTQHACFEVSEGLDAEVRKFLDRVSDPQMPVVVGLDSAKLRFLELSLPPAPVEQLPLLIRTQAESQLPLDSERMQLAWRLSPAVQGYTCTVAATRQDTTDAAVGRLHLNSQLVAMVPDTTGFAHLRDMVFGPTAEMCVVLRRRSDGFALILLDGTTPLRSSVVSVEPSDMTECPGLVMQDIQSELDAMTQPYDGRIPIYVWPAEDPDMQRITERLTRAGRQVQPLTVEQAALEQAGLQAAELSGPALDAAGLAMLGLSADKPAFDFMEIKRLNRPAEEVARRKKRIIRAAWLVAILALLCGAVSYWSLQLQVSRLRSELAVEVEGLKADTLLSQQTYQEAVARARLDMLEIIEAIQDSRDGLLLDSLEFEAGKPVKLVATASGYEQVYAFQKRLEAREGVSQARLIDPRLDERTRQVRFTLQFQYKHFTK